MEVSSWSLVGLPSTCQSREKTHCPVHDLGLSLVVVCFSICSPCSARSSSMLASAVTPCPVPSTLHAWQDLEVLLTLGKGLANGTDSGLGANGTDSGLGNLAPKYPLASFCVNESSSGLAVAHSPRLSFFLPPPPTSSHGLREQSEMRPARMIGNLVSGSEDMGFMHPATGPDEPAVARCLGCLMYPSDPSCYVFEMLAFLFLFFSFMDKHKEHSICLPTVQQRDAGDG